MQPVVGRVSNRRRGLRDQLAVRGIRNDTTLCDRLLHEADVAILPGSAFGRSGDELTARLAYIDFHGRRALAAAERTSLERDLPEDFADRFCRRVVQGVERIAEWAYQKTRQLDIPYDAGMLVAAAET